jgi:hypothetical protein
VALYFLAGLLPDPDGPFEPSPSHFSAWILGAIFEVVLTTGTATSLSGPRTARIALGVLRVVILLAMAISYVFINWKPLLSDGDLEASEGLLDSNGNGHVTYGVIDGKPISSQQHAVRQKGGWLDYFIGFRILFPYIWYFLNPNRVVG